MKGGAARLAPVQDALIDHMTADPPIDQMNDDVEHATSMRAVQDRRRPGRMQHVSPTLLELLRSRSNAEVPSGDDDTGNPLWALRGILLWAVVGAAMWAGLFWMIAALLR